MKKMMQWMMAITVLAVGSVWAVADTTYYVSPEGNHIPPFTTLNNAATNIQAALDVAVSGDTVLVGADTYTLTEQLNVTNGIILKSVSGPDLTIVDGGFVPGSAVTNNRCIKIDHNDAVVSGFTFRNGALWCGSEDPGAGIAMYGGFVTNCTVVDNTIYCPGDREYIGGAGVYLFGGSIVASRVNCNVAEIPPGNTTSFIWGGGIHAKADTLISGCIVSNNSINGGISSHPGGAGVFFGGSATIRSCLVCDNKTDRGFGGGIWLRNIGGTIDGCTFSRNYGLYAGGAAINPSALVTVTNCMFSYNACGSYAAALHLGNKTGQVNIIDTTITGNTNGYFKGEMIRCQSPNSLFKNCEIVDNHVQHLRNDVALYYSILNLDTTSENCLVVDTTISHNTGGYAVGAKGGVLRNCLISDNTNNAVVESWEATLLNGAGVHLHADCEKFSMSGCTIAGNVDAADGSAGSGLRFANTVPRDVTVSSCIIAANGLNGTDDVCDVSTSATNSTVFQYSCLGVNPGFTGTGLIEGDPRFKNQAVGDYRLSSHSPCVDTGSNEVWMVGAVDLDGNRRIRHGTVDMGAFEFIWAASVFLIR